MEFTPEELETLIGLVKGEKYIIEHLCGFRRKLKFEEQLQVAYYQNLIRKLEALQ
jgi:hypothetical protein